MKNMLFLSLCLLALTMANPTQGTHNPQHTFLVKTDLTKEQIVNLLNEYHRNHTNHEQEMETGVHHENETIELKVKKEKKQKTHNQQVQENKPESPKEVHGSPHHKTENKQVETPETPKKPEIPEQPEAPEQQEAPEAPEAPESPENQEVTEEEKTNLKKKKKNKEEFQKLFLKYKDHALGLIKSTKSFKKNIIEEIENNFNLKFNYDIIKDLDKTLKVNTRSKKK